MEEFKLAVFGAYSWGQLFGFTWFFILGYILYALDETADRDKKSPKTPDKWSWRFWFFDNWRRYIATFIFTYLFFRFFSEITVREISNFECTVYGMMGDGLATRVKARFNLFKANREKLLQEEPVAQP